MAENQTNSNIFKSLFSLNLYAIAETGNKRAEARQRR